MPRRAVPVRQRGDARHVPQAVRFYILAGQDQQHAGHAARRGRVDAHDARMRYGRAQHIAMDHAGQHDVIGVTALSGDEPKILETPQRLADRELHLAS